MPPEHGVVSSNLTGRAIPLRVRPGDMGLPMSQALSGSLLSRSSPSDANNSLQPLIYSCDDAQRVSVAPR